MLALEIRVPAIERGRLADDLDDVRRHRLRQLVGRGPGIDVGISPELDLHQFLSAQGIVERLLHRLAETVLPDVDGRGEMMSFAAQLGAFLRGEWHTPENYREPRRTPPR